MSQSFACRRVRPDTITLQFSAEPGVFDYNLASLLYTIRFGLAHIVARRLHARVAAPPWIRQLHRMTSGPSSVSLPDRGAAAPDIAQDLSAAILSHRLSPGQKLGEDDLGEIYGVSRTIVRSALQALAHQKLVEIRRNRGAFVASPTPREAHEVFEARRLVEPHVTESAARKATPQDIAVLKQHVAQEHAAVAAGRRGEALAMSGRFHVEIARIADQAIIADMVRSLVERSSLIIALYWRKQSSLCETGAHHDLLDAIAAGDVGLSRDLMERHLDDLHDGLDLRPPDQLTVSLKDALFSKD